MCFEVLQPSTLTQTKKETYFNCGISGQKALDGLIHENNRPITHEDSNKGDEAGSTKANLRHRALDTIPIHRPLSTLDDRIRILTHNNPRLLFQKPTML